MPINLIFSILSKVYFKKSKQPKPVIDKKENVQIINVNQIKTFAPITNKKNKPSKIIDKAQIKDVARSAINQVYNIFTDYIMVYTGQQNEKLDKQPKKDTNSIKTFVTILLIGLVGAGLYIIYKYINKIKNIISQFFEICEIVFDYFSEFVVWLGKIIIDKIVDVINFAKNTIKNLYNKIYTIISNKIKIIKKDISDFFNNKIDLIANYLNNIVDSIDEDKLIESIWDYVDKILTFNIFTISFFDKGEKDDNYDEATLNRKSLDNVSDDIINESLLFNSNEEQLDEQQNDIELSKTDLSSLNNYKFNMPDVQMKDVVKINQDLPAEDLIIHANNIQKNILNDKYIKIKQAINQIDSLLNKTIDIFDNNVQININKWKTYFVNSSI